jgi:ethanolamine utilization protein EutQ
MQPVNVMSSEKSPVRIVGFDDIEFAPRFEYGEMAEVAGVCGSDDGSELVVRPRGVGWGRLRNARIPWTIRYDEVLTVFEGELRLHTGGEVHQLQPRDCIWLPAGTELVYEADAALVHFAIHPFNWHEIS